MEYNWKSNGFKRNLQNILESMSYTYGFKTPQDAKDFCNIKPKLHDPFLFNNMQKVIDKINYYIDNNKLIMIAGDYDADGIGATKILYTCLKYLNANVVCKLPHRIYDGYGLKNKTIDYAKENNVELIITVDNGITAVDAIEYSKSLGIDIIVTDHHEPKNVIPNCLILNPQLKDSGYPFKCLCGAGVAFKLATALIKNNKNMDIENTSIYSEIIQTCCISTIADVMLLIDENRTIVIDGLYAINNSPLIGIKKLLQILKFDKSKKEKDGDSSKPNNTDELFKNKVTSDYIAFSIAPCLNAAGRVDCPSKALNLLLVNNEDEAEILAREISLLNDKRKRLQRSIFDELHINEADNCIIELIDGEFAGIGGIVASSVVEKYHKPCFILHGNGEVVSGSARTYGDFEVIDCLTKNKHLIIDGGGHKGACGLAIRRENVDLFKEACSNIFNDWLKNNPDAMNPTLSAVCEINFDMISGRLKDNIDKLAPFGMGHEEPMFITRRVTVESYDIKEEKDYIKFSLSQNNSFNFIDAINFKQIKQRYIDMGYPKNIDILYKINYNEFYGNKKIQLHIVDFKVSNK